MEEHISDSRRNFSYFLTVVIEKLLNLVLKESNEVAEEIEKVRSALNRICSNEACKTIYEKVKYKCDNGNSKVIKYKPEITSREKSSGTDERYKLSVANKDWPTVNYSQSLAFD